MADTAARHMQCMEVWGGNRVVDTAVSLPGLDAWIYSRPFKSDAGGDVHYVSSCATGRITRLLVADVCGHGQAVASIAIQLRTLMRRFVNHIDQTRFVESMNRHFAEMAEAGSFATAVVNTYFAPTRHLTVCNAGHPPPLIYRDQSKQWAILEERTSGNIPLGIAETRYEQFDVRLEAGDWVMCYTDSLIEAKSEAGEMLGVKGLLEMARAIPPVDAGTFVPALLGAIAMFAPRGLEADDVTVLLFRANPDAARGKMRNVVLAPVRVLRAFAASLVGAGPAAWPDLRLANVGGAMFPPLSRLWGKGRRKGGGGA